MNVVPLTGRSLDDVARAMRHGRPWLPETTDYWLWRECFGDTSFIALDGENPIAAILACIPQSRPHELYIDQVAVDPQWRGRGVTQALFHATEAEGRKRGCRHVWLSTDPANPARRAWPRVGFASQGVKKDFKGPGKDREIFAKAL